MFNLAILPSSFRISHITPDGYSPASFGKSTDASVCPALLNTPPSIDLNGKIWPGLEKLDASILGSTSALTVFDLSEAEIPVVTPLPFKSTETVKEVPYTSVFLPTIRSKPNSLHLSDSREQQIKPLPSLAMKFIISGVTFEEAQTKSPSFSLDSSSTTIIISPFFIASIASGIVFNLFFIRMLHYLIFLQYQFQLTLVYYAILLFLHLYLPYQKYLNFACYHLSSFGLI